MIPKLRSSAHVCRSSGGYSTRDTDADIKKFPEEDVHRPGFLFHGLFMRALMGPAVSVVFLVNITFMVARVLPFIEKGHEKLLTWGPALPAITRRRVRSHICPGLEDFLVKTSLQFTERRMSALNARVKLPRCETAHPPNFGACLMRTTAGRGWLSRFCSAEAVARCSLDFSIENSPDVSIHNSCLNNKNNRSSRLAKDL